MIILENHFGNKKTYIIGKYIINGCQRFKIEDIDEVCEKYKVSDKEKIETKYAYYKNQLDEKEDYLKLVYHEDYVVKNEIVRLKLFNHILVHDEDWKIRFKIALQRDQLHILIKDKDHYVRAVAQKHYTILYRIKSFLNKLIWN